MTSPQKHRIQFLLPLIKIYINSLRFVQLRIHVLCFLVSAIFHVDDSNIFYVYELQIRCNLLKMAAVVAFEEVFIWIVMLEVNCCYRLKGSENAVAKAILKCLQCFLWCLEKCLKFLNKNAYIVIAMTGKSFCPSAQQVTRFINHLCLMNFDFNLGLKLFQFSWRPECTGPLKLDRVQNLTLIAIKTLVICTLKWLEFHSIYTCFEGKSSILQPMQ